MNHERNGPGSEQDGSEAAVQGEGDRPRASGRVKADIEDLQERADQTRAIRVEHRDEKAAVLIEVFMLDSLLDIM